MNCPSCNFHTEAPSDSFCVRCGFSLAKYGAKLVQLRDMHTWVLRRSLAGFTAGMVGWWIIPATIRATEVDLSAGQRLSPSMYLVISGVLGGIFLGSVEGMLEESSLKTVRGAVLGALGGLLGAALGCVILKGASAESPGMLAVVVAWAIAGACIGTVSAWLEKSHERLAAGALAGAIGGAFGGWLGYQMSSSLMDVVRPEWGIKRIIEGMTGAILGAVLWFVLGVAEKIFIFRRRVVHHVSYKECDHCRTHNVFRAWYCAGCGAVLQVAAPQEKLVLPRRQALARFIAACQYLARLSALSSAVIAILSGIFLGTINPFLGLFGMLASVLAGYMIYTLMNALAELLSPVL